MIKTNALSAISWAVPILLATAGSAAADPVFSINATLATPAGTISDIGSHGAPIVTGLTQDAGIPGAAVTVTYGVVAKPGNIGSLSGATALAPGNSIFGQAGAIADVALDNLEIIYPGVPAGTPVFYDINFAISGSIVVAAFGSSSASAGVSLTYLTTLGTGTTLGTAFASTVPGASGASGIFSGGVSFVMAQTPVEAGFVDEDVYAEFILATHADVGASPSGITQGLASASSDFLDPFSFPTNGPVFNFFDANGDPLAGVTADSSDGCIVNNAFMCGSITSPGSVPELSTWAMMVAAFAGLGYAGWRRGRRPGATRIGKEIGL
jgi:hypothetical protein